MDNVLGYGIKQTETYVGYEDKSNARLAQGWLLISVGTTFDGDPVFIVGRPYDVAADEVEPTTEG